MNTKDLIIKIFFCLFLIPSVFAIDNNCEWRANPIINNFKITESFELEGSGTFSLTWENQAGADKCYNPKVILLKYDSEDKYYSLVSVECFSTNTDCQVSSAITAPYEDFYDHYVNPGVSSTQVFNVFTSEFATTPGTYKVSALIVCEEQTNPLCDIEPAVTKSDFSYLYIDLGIDTTTTTTTITSSTTTHPTTTTLQTTTTTQADSGSYDQGSASQATTTSTTTTTTTTTMEVTNTTIPESLELTGMTIGNWVPYIAILVIIAAGFLYFKPRFSGGKPSLQNKFCENCGKELLPGYQFCENCGKKI